MNDYNERKECIHMKCQNCNLGEYQTVETLRIDGVKNNRQVCNECDDEHFEPLELRHTHKYRLNRNRLSEMAYMAVTMCVIFGVVMYICLHLDKFMTVY
jgi:hypothetical protein